jgi:hypothetical protein
MCLSCYPLSNPCYPLSNRPSAYYGLQLLGSVRPTLPPLSVPFTNCFSYFLLPSLSFRSSSPNLAKIPSRAPSAYNNFAAQRLTGKLGEVGSSTAQSNFSEKSKAVSAEWKAMSDAEKAVRPPLPSLALHLRFGRYRTTLVHPTHTLVCF